MEYLIGFLIGAPLGSLLGWALLEDKHYREEYRRLLREHRQQYLEKQDDLDLHY